MNSLLGLIPVLISYLLDLVFIYMILTTSRSKITNILTWVTNIILSFGLFVIITRLGFMNVFVGYLLGSTAIVCDLFLFKEEYYKIIFVALGIWSISSFFSSAAIGISNIFFNASPYIALINASPYIVFFRSLIDISMYIPFLSIFYFYIRKPMKMVLNLSSKINYFYYTVPSISFVLFCAIFGPTKEHNTFLGFILMDIMFFLIISLYYLIFSSIYNRYNNDLQILLLDKMEKANRNLRVEAISDELTNIPNRRGVKNYIDQVWEESEKRPINLALLMIDIDFFKRYNDYYGHIEGDTCLINIAECLKSVLGDRNGILGRFGGEEFVCFIKETEYKDVIDITELLRSSIEKLGINYIWNNECYPVTISIGGVFGCISDFNSSQDMYLIADEELYKAKNEGRNKVLLKNKNIL
ncbi:GGDEF domain-containing protein [Clostridium sp.]|uniref:GGDEF domain-containing protein n=1 Tax=Clostridium sp. TaxID=1506 RepID=UPI001A4684BA|nr:GGDEF domain-containing protein [Clostridium sp.]MBK5236027.1 GGDEF domain-containing protein [Clostridium sp.]